VNNNYLAIMAGGIGSRFWPASNEEKPKQFLDILGVGTTLLQSTYDRYKNLFHKENIFVVTNSKYNDLVLSQLPNLSLANVINEPSRNNTAPSVAYTSLKIKKLNPDANIVMAPSDHLILKEMEFINIIQKSLDFTSKNDAIITLGIPPDRPDTGYGYIEFNNEIDQIADNIYKVKSFKEKPDIATAESYLSQKKYLWNAGIFIFKAENIISAFKKYSPEIFRILHSGYNLFNSDSEKEFIQKNYPTTPNISIDYAIMEKADNIYTIPADISWSDLGTWNSLHAFLNKDNSNNAAIDSKCRFLDSTGNIIKSSHNKKVYIKDLHNYIIVDDNDTLLIYPINKEQEIKDIDKT
jgi:mannose-1-phosphate guanylyltransferase